ncbi:hypothetical protein JQC92_10105 [Shewanella sp. 202IG2-18]|uniref:hypothetical protein n=1 Tax=Parashewanella hymeniacidonis TaxID=2807618 RepID=UPI00195F3C50|nr:hypothetical protein [Parashewanella hymeniacidonis]MBM7072381.1 hypothetical protein [Parashewanella hymeniacidonis]
MRKYITSSITLLLLAQVHTASAVTVSNNQDSLMFDYHRLQGSISVIDMSHVQKDYIRQEIYLEELVTEMTKDISQNINLPEVKDIAADLNNLGASSSTGEVMYQIPYEQMVYYKSPLDSSAEILGRKAVGTAIYEQYIESKLEALNNELKSAKLCTLDKFISENKKAYQQLDSLTTQVYQHSKKSRQISMNLGFEYEQYLLAYYSSSLKKFYK